MSYGTVQAEKMTTESGYSLGAGNASSFKNRFINGNMTISQRNAGSSVTINSNQYTLDRWQAVQSQGGKYSVQQDAGAVTPPVGFTDYLGATSLTAHSLSAGDFFYVRQQIEGYNVADFALGTASAKTFTLSFWVRSSLTGTFGGTFANGASDSVYPFTYTISAANTWEQKSITVTGRTSGTWDTTTGTGLYVLFSLGAGTNFLGTAGAWSSSLFLGATGQTNVVATNGATFYLTGCQLEVGTVATSFDFRSFGTELALCQRYYQKSYNINVVPGTATDVGAVVTGVGSTIPTTSSIEGGFPFKVTMRAAPTLVGYDRVGNSGVCSRINVGIASSNNQNLSFDLIGAGSTYVASNGSANASSLILMYTASAEL
jgi:hypothetical protein